MPASKSHAALLSEISRPITSRSAIALLPMLGLALSMARAGTVDLTRSIILAPAELSRPERKAAAMLVDEVAKRTGIRWPVVSSWPAASGPVIVVGQAPAVRALVPEGGVDLELGASAGAAEGYRLLVDARQGSVAVGVIGHDERGVLYGVGGLLRHLRMVSGEVTLSDQLKVSTSPAYAVRGHQLGYRPKTHSYDAWDIEIWEQYYRDLVVFGANAIELIPPRSDDDADSPHFPLPPMEMMKRMSGLADDYGLDVWIWYPALDADYSNPATLDAAVKEWAGVFEQLPRIDAVFIPGGDPGHTRPRDLLALLGRQATSLRRFHSKAQMWVSPQGFDREWMEEFLGILKDKEPRWLSGVVFGPQVRLSLPELRARVPKRYPIRHYPDITHTRQCQYPVPDWDVAFAITEGRECINPRPLDQAAIFRLLQPHTIGFLTYSEGCNDDVNKAIWSALGWDQDRPVIEILRDYSRYFIGERYAEGFAQGYLALERNWRGPLIANSGVETTLRQYQAMEEVATPADRSNWRFQQALFRAYYDAYLRDRLLHETVLEERAMERLRGARAGGSLAAIREAEEILDRSLTEGFALDLKARVFDLAESLYQSIRMQLSVSRYRAIGVDRGASLDTIDLPLNNRLWFKERFAGIRQSASEEDRVRAIAEIVDWTNPGPGGFYDDFGDPARQPHLVRGLPFERDPASLVSSKIGFEEGEIGDKPDLKPERALRISWMQHAESLIDEPLRVRYTGLEPDASYVLRVVYGGDSPKRKIRLVANDRVEIHPWIAKPFPIRPIEFEIPVEAVRSGGLELSWSREPGLGGNGRGCQVSELWLIRK